MPTLTLARHSMCENLSSLKVLTCSRLKWLPTLTLRVNVRKPFVAITLLTCVTQRVVQEFGRVKKPFVAHAPHPSPPAMRSAVFKREFDSVKNFRRSLFTCVPTRCSSRVLHLPRRGVLLLRASSASPRCSSPAGAFGAAHHARFLYGLVAHVLHHGEIERPLLETSPL